MSDNPLSMTSPFMQHLLLWLRPFFQAFGDSDDAFDAKDLMATLHAYGPNNRKDMLHAALSLAFSVSAIDTLARADADKDMSASMRLRYRSCANSLNRSAERHAGERNGGQRDIAAQAQPGTQAQPRQDTLAQPRQDTPAQPRQDTLAQPRQDTPAQPRREQPAQPNITDQDARRLLNEADAALTTTLNRLLPSRLAFGSSSPRHMTSLSHLFGVLPPVPAARDPVSV